MDEQQRIASLVRAAQEGQREAFDGLVRHFEPMVLGTVLRRVRNRADAEEVAQDVFLQALRKLPQLREPERFAGWLRTIAVNMSINRTLRRPPETTHGPEVLHQVESTPETPCDALLRSERAARVRAGLERLGELDRRTLEDFYFRGRSLKEMSVRFDCPIGTIKRRLHSARARLQKELADLQPAPSG